MSARPAPIVPPLEREETREALSGQVLRGRSEHVGHGGPEVSETRPRAEVDRDLASKACHQDRSVLSRVVR